MVHLLWVWIHCLPCQHDLCCTQFFDSHCFAITLMAELAVMVCLNVLNVLNAWCLTVDGCRSCVGGFELAVFVLGMLIGITVLPLVGRICWCLYSSAIPTGCWWLHSYWFQLLLALMELLEVVPFLCSTCLTLTPAPACWVEELCQDVCFMSLLFHWFCSYSMWSSRWT